MLNESTKIDTTNTAEEDKEPTVQDYLEMALQLAGEQGMKTSELMGIFYYYTHSIAESYREDVLKS